MYLYFVFTAGSKFGYPTIAVVINVNDRMEIQAYVKLNTVLSITSYPNIEAYTQSRN